VANRPVSLWISALDQRVALLAALRAGGFGGAVSRVARIVADALAGERKVVFFGNGGSAASAQHAAAELVGRFERNRAALAAIALTADGAGLTAMANDYGFDRVFERQIEGLVKPRDVAIALSTSGRSPNVLRGLRAARRRGAITVALLGQGGGPARRLADHTLVVPSSRVPLIQEAHDLIIHVLCEEVERLLRSRI
jgi:D-sedoheptulose 7-phosphate isomerase